MIHHEVYYGVFGKIENEEFSFEKYGVKITFKKGVTVPCDRTGEYFGVCVEGDFAYILDEERELPFNFRKKLKNSVFGIEKKYVA